MKTLCFCERHPKARSVPVGTTREGFSRFLCARCSAVMVVGEGTIVDVDGTAGRGLITPGGAGPPLPFKVDNEHGFHVGMRVLFEYAVAASDGDGHYERAAMNVRPLEG